MKKICLLLCMSLSACCTADRLYIYEVRNALRENVRPAYVEALEYTPWPQEVKDQKLKLLDQAIESSTRIEEEDAK